MSSIKRFFLGSDVRLRCVWRLMAAYAGWFMLFISASLAVSGILSALFGAWGVTSRNLRLAPVWVQYLAVYQTRIAHILCAAVTAAAGYAVCRKHAPVRLRIRSALTGFAAGIACVVLITGLFLLTDSIRTASAKPAFSAHIPLMLVYFLVLSAAEGFAAMGYVRATTASRAGKIPSVIAATVMFLIMNHYAAGSVVGLINLLFIAVAGCCIAEKYGVAAFIGLRAGWLWAETSLAGYPGSTGAVFSVYPVSEHLLTGGFNGLTEGLATTLCCSAVIFFLLICPEIRKKA